MENQYFTPTNPLCVWVQRILPLVYDDSLSYYEVLAKVVEKINILINNNNNIPAYVKQVFNEFVKSGDLEKLVKQILDKQDIVVNVKYPPENVTAALGDGATNDTAAFNSCIDYAMKNGIPVYIPAGTYMLDAVTITGDVQIFGTPKTNLYLNVKPEAGAMFTIEGGNIRLFNLTAYGQHAKQPGDTTFLYVNEQSANVEVKTVSVCEFNRGFELLGTKSFKAESCNFVNNGMNAITASSNAYKVTIDNCCFDGLTERNATTYIICNSNGLRLMNAEFLAGASIGINYVDSEDVFIHYYKTNIETPVTGTGVNPIIIENNGKIKYALDDDITVYIANLILNTSGDMTLETHDMTLNAARLTETIAGEKASQAAKRTDVVSGTASLEAGAVEVQTTQGEKHEVAGQFNVHAGSYKMLDVVRRTPTGTANYVDEAPIVDNAGNNKALLVKGETDINTAINKLVTDFGNLDQDISDLNGIPARVETLESKVTKNTSDITQLQNDVQFVKSDVEDLQREVANITLEKLTTSVVNLAAEKILTAQASIIVTDFNIEKAGTYLVQLYARTDDTKVIACPFITDNPTTSIIANKKYFNLNAVPITHSVITGENNYPTVTAVIPLTAGTWYLQCQRQDAGADGTKVIFPTGRCITLTRLSD